MFLRAGLGIFLAVSLLACESKTAIQKPEAKKPATNDDLLSDVAKQPTYGDQALRVLKGARQVQKEMKEQRKEEQEIKSQTD